MLKFFKIKDQKFQKGFTFLNMVKICTENFKSVQKVEKILKYSKMNNRSKCQTNRKVQKGYKV